MTSGQRLLTIAEAAPMLRKSEAAFRYYLNTPDCLIPKRKVGGRVHVWLSDVEAVTGKQDAPADTTYDDGYRDGYRQALADIRAALNQIDK